MGINGWFTVFGDSASSHDEKEFNGKCLGIDVSYDIYRASLGMKNIKGLTDKTGEPTILLNTLLRNIARYKKLGVKGLIYVFDNPEPNQYKLKENEKRKLLRKKMEKKMADEDRPEMKDVTEKRTFTITSKMIDDVMKMLTLIGVAWIIAPEGYEAEHLGAELATDGVIDTFITSDSDTLLFGGKSMTRRKRTKDKKYIYEEYTLDCVLTDYELDRKQLIHLGVVLGCDFANKTKGIGPGTILAKGLAVKLTDEQTTALNYFMSKCPYNKSQITKNNINKELLVDWLVDDKNFNRNRVETILSVF